MIRRDPAGAADREHDIVVVGGGIYGACLSLEAARAGLRPLLLERGDFGQATSWNSLRILHGGFRYLPALDLVRFRESITERRWFCRTFPELVRPLECLMPLYGEGLKRPLVFGSALLINDWLSCDRNAGVDRARRLPRGRVLGVSETIARFPLVHQRGLRGAGVWYDAVMVNSQRVLLEILRWACSLGATALNYVEAVALERRGGRISGVQARDLVDGRTRTFACRAVCNAAGPWSGDVAARFDRRLPQLFRPSLAFNVLLDRDPPSASAVAVAPRRSGREDGPVYFLVPAFGRLVAGTMHLPWAPGRERAEPSDQEVERLLSDVNASVPGLDVRPEDVIRRFAGLLPAAAQGTAKLAIRPIIRDHGREGGPQGLVSVSGVKFTTARLVAERTLALVRARLGRPQVRSDSGRPTIVSDIDFDRPGELEPETLQAVKRLAEDEAVVTMDDLLFRRTNWAIVERDVDALRRRVSAALGWKGESHDARRHSLAASDVQPHAQEEAAAGSPAPRSWSS